MSGVSGGKFPPGSIISYGGATAPEGWLICDGSEVGRMEYAELYAAIQDTWGAGDGVDTFNLPDFRGRVLMGSGTGAGLTARTLGQTLGTETHTLTAAQSGLPAHHHTVPWRDNTCAGGSDNPTGSMTDLPDQEIETSDEGADASEAHPNIQPSAVVQLIIKW